MDVKKDIIQILNLILMIAKFVKKTVKNVKVRKYVKNVFLEKIW